jgi:hypothetical protein
MPGTGLYLRLDPQVVRQASNPAIALCLDKPRCSSRSGCCSTELLPWNKNDTGSHHPMSTVCEWQPVNPCQWLDGSQPNPCQRLDGSHPKSCRRITELKLSGRHYAKGEIRKGLCRKDAGKRRKTQEDAGRCRKDAGKMQERCGEVQKRRRGAAGGARIQRALYLI